MPDKERKMMAAIKAAKAIIDYVAYDTWEREVTEKDRKKFYKICDELGLKD